MERKDYAEKFMQVKNEILEEIRKLIPCNNVHKFKETFYIHYVNGDVATTEICNAVEVWNEGMVAFIVFNESGDEEVIEGEGVFQYDEGSFLDILDRLQKEVREQKLETIRGIVKASGNRLEFDNKFRFTGFDGDSECEFVGLLALSLNEDGKLNIEDEWQDGLYTNSENFIPDSELDRFIDYVKNQTMKKFKIRAYETFSRTFDIEACTYEEAIEKVKEELERFPFEEGDSDGLAFS